MPRLGWISKTTKMPDQISRDRRHTITIEGDANGAAAPGAGLLRQKVLGQHSHRTFSGGIGHNPP
jgi:hypothetical protein